MIWFFSYLEYRDHVSRAKSNNHPYSKISFDDFLTIYKKKISHPDYKPVDTFFTYDIVYINKVTRPVAQICLSKTKIEIASYNFYFSYVDYLLYYQWYKKELERFNGNIYDPTIVDKLKGEL